MKENREKERRCIVSDIRLEKRSNDETGRTISGYAIKFGVWSSPLGRGWRFIEKINPNALDDCDMSDTIATFNHNVNDIMARTSSGTLTLSVDEIGLKFSYEAPNTTIGNDTVERIKRGDITQCSFIMEVESEKWTYADEENHLECDQREIEKISKLWDIALVVYPAYKDSEVSVRSLEEYHERQSESGKLNAELEIREREFQYITIQNNG